MEGDNTGTFLTFAQFVYVTLQTLSSQFYLPPAPPKSTMWQWLLRAPRMRQRKVPLKRWMMQVVLFLAVSLSVYFSLVPNRSHAEQYG
jgi:UDP-xylose/UDP-N-acetylglucosamine transporter B4